VITHVDLNWFNGSIEELERKYVLGDNSYPNKVESVQDENGEILEENAGAKLLPIAQTQNISRGDFQEPSHQRRIIQPRNAKIAIRNSKDFRESNDHEREEEWIRAYFLQKTETL
jgi:hypothetical protein